jgi:formamidopyrimidine-DNA glycosylase
VPELPEVETVVRGLRAPLIGHTVLSIWSDWHRTLRTPAAADFATRIVGQTFRAVRRRAKYILCDLDHDILIVHLKMTGRLYVTADDAAHDADHWVHFRAQLNGGQQLRFSDARKFGFVALVSSLEEIAPNLGPEPLEDDFTAEVLAERLQKRGAGIKGVLLDQGVLAGVGNIYADEALWRSHIHPLRSANGLSSAELVALHTAIRESLAGGIEHEGASVNWYRKPDGTTGEAQEHFHVYDRGGQPCHRCGTLISKTRVAGRGTHFCPQCQPAKSS